MGCEDIAGRVLLRLIDNNIELVNNIIIIRRTNRALRERLGPNPFGPIRGQCLLTKFFVNKYRSEIEFDKGLVTLQTDLIRLQRQKIIERYTGDCQL